MPILTTVSTCAPESEQGKLVFRIVGYSQHRGTADKFIKSGIFSVGGHDWMVAFCPDCTWSSQDNVEVELVFMGKSKVQACFELKLVNQHTGLSFSIHKEALRTFDPNTEISINLEQRSLFESPNYLHDDCLTIECFVTVIKGRCLTETKSLPRIEVPPPDIAEHFAKLLETEEGVDVTFSVDGASFKAHKVVLATRSPMFKAEL